MPIRTNKIKIFYILCVFFAVIVVVLFYLFAFFLFATHESLVIVLFHSFEWQTSMRGLDNSKLMFYMRAFK